MLMLILILNNFESGVLCFWLFTSSLF